MKVVDTYYKRTIAKNIIASKNKRLTFLLGVEEAEEGAEAAPPSFPLVDPKPNRLSILQT